MTTPILLRSDSVVAVSLMRATFGLQPKQRLGFHWSPPTGKKKTESGPSLSGAKWKDISGTHNLPSNPALLSDLPRFSTPLCRLPPSFHQDVGVAAWGSLDVFSEPLVQIREAPRARTLEAVCNKLRLITSRTKRFSDGIQYLVPIVALFQGRITDQPEELIVETEYSSGGKVEHEVSSQSHNSLTLSLMLDSVDRV
jgi:hypothetical protein